MYELVYCSEAIADLKNDEILNILKTAREFNAENNITGCLLFYNNQFVQILEGEKNIIKDLYERIEKDKRHEYVVLLSHGDKEERSFPNWNMAFKELSANNFIKLTNKNLEDNFNAFADLAEKPTQAIHVFWSMAKQFINDKN